MASSNTTLAGLWVDDASSSSPVKHTITVSTPTRMSSAGNTIDIKDDMLQFYKDSGLEPMAKEVGILDSQGELQGYAAVSGPKGVQMIAVPIQQSPAKSPAIKVEQIQVQRQVVQTPPHRVVTPATGLYMRTPTNQQQHQHQQAQSPWQQHTTPASMVSAGMSGGRKRTVDIMEGDYTGSAVKSGGSRGHKGLRHFSTKVCEKVEKKGTTTYGEVADELVRELNDPFFSQVGEYDQKNIRRRVYDALNVLMAMNIISKEKKEIKWIGLPTNSAQEVHNLETEKKRRQERIRHKTSQLQELILQQIAFKNLVNRNRENERLAGKKPSSNSSIQLPYIIVNTSKRTVIDCSISNDKYEYLFNFDNTFEIHDDIEVLKRMGMAFGLEKNQCSQEDVKKALRMVPKALEPYVLELANPSGTSGARIGLGASLSAASSSSASSMDLDTDTRGSGGGALSRQSSMLRGGDDLDEDMDDDVDVYSDSGADDSERSSPTPSHARLH